MSNVFPKGLRFVPFPALISETIADWTEAEIRLYIGLLTIAQKHTATKLHLPSFVIHDYTGLHSETVTIARRKLERRNLIRCGKGAGGVSIYELMNPVTGETLPAPVVGTRKFSGVYIYRSDDGRTSRTARAVPKVFPDQPATAPSWDELSRSDPIRSVAMTKPTRNYVTDSLVSGFPEVDENAKVSKAHASSFEISIRKEVLNKVVGRISIGTKGNVEVVKKEELGEKQDRPAPAKSDAPPVAENLDAKPTHRAELEPVVIRIREKFGATILSIIDKPEWQETPSRGRAADNSLCAARGLRA